jgi:hypothetical protein
VKDSDAPYATPGTRPGDAPAARGSLARGVLSGFVAIAVGLGVMAALQFLAFGILDGEGSLSLLLAMLSLPWVPIAVAQLAGYHVNGGRAASGWGVLLAAAVALALLVTWTNLPPGMREWVATAIALS